MAVLILVRRIEALLLVLLAASLAFVDRGSMVPEVVLLAIALVLLCQNLRVRPKPEIMPQIDDLVARGLKVYSAYLAASKLRASWPKTKQIALTQYESEKWVDRARAVLKPYPEFRGIFEAYEGATPREAVANRIRRLHEIKRLLELGERLGMRRA